MRAFILLMAALVATTPAFGLELYMNGSAGYGRTATTHDCQYERDKFGDPQLEQCRTADGGTGPLVAVEAGVEHDRWALFFNHTSDPSTGADVGTTMLGVRLEVRKRLAGW